MRVGGGLRARERAGRHAGCALTKQIDVSGPVGGALRAVMEDLLADAVARLGARKGDVHEAVHDARKNLKAFRSCLRLVRAEIGDAYDELNVQARDAARALAGARDTQALHDAIGQIEKSCGQRRDRPDTDALHKAADAEAERAASDRAIRQAAREVAALLSPCRRQVRGWRLPDGPDAYVAGLRRTYRAARRALRQGLDTHLPEDLHEARKRVIHWRYQLDLFTGLWPRVVRAEVRELQDLREDLGQHNDLVLLETRIRDRAGGFASLPDTDPVLDAITVLRARRARAAARRGALLFSMSPGNQKARLSRWWAASLAR